MLSGLVGKRGDMQSAQDNERASGAVLIRKPVGTSRAGDVDLNDDKIGSVVAIDWTHMFILEDGLVVWRKVGRQRGQPERWKE
jgi:hypothetical protein